MTRVVILGAGFGGLELATLLSEALGEDAAVTLIDRSESFYFGFSKLDVLFGRSTADEIKLPYTDFRKPGVTFRRETINAIDPSARTVTTDRASYEAEVLVVALGAEYDVGVTPGFREHGHEFYSLPGAERLRDALPSFGGGKVAISVIAEPYICPPAPFEGALLLHDYFVGRGMRDAVEMTVSGFMGAPVPVSEQVSTGIHRLLDERGIGYVAKRSVATVEDRWATFAEGDGLEFDLFIGIPVHRVPHVVAESGLAPNGWIPVETANLETRFPNVYAIGDVAAMQTAKAGVFSERAARTVADDVVSRIRGRDPTDRFDGAGICYIEVGGGVVARVEANFLGGPSPTGVFLEPSVTFAAVKEEFARERRARWFGS
jgi:sulfide:quinone oxidoreductase